MTHPNILIITTDHQRTDALGCYDSPWAVSPHIDALAAGGVRFDHCICQSPSCTPSRSSLWTGRYVHSLGAAAFRKAPLTAPLLTGPFQAAGYQLAQFGKFDLTEHRDEFDLCEGVDAPGQVLGPWCEEVPPGTSDADCQILRSPTTNYVIGGVNPLGQDRTLSNVLVTRAERFLAAEAKPPFFLRVSINVPHMPFTPLPQYFGVTDRDKIDLPIADPAELATKPQRESRHLRPFYGFDQLSADELRHCRGCFYDLCTELDAAIGRLMAAVRRHGFADDTIVMLHSDHGTTLGEHGLGTIRTFYEPVVKVPLIWSWPGRLEAASTVEDPVELIDLMPTLIDLAGLDCPSEVHDRSLRAQMLGEASDPHRPTFSEYDTSLSPIGGADWIPEAARWSPAHDRRVMVRRDGWKLECNYGPSDYGEDGGLYDLQRDPLELDNLFSRPQHAAKVEALKAVTVNWLERTKGGLSA